MRILRARGFTLIELMLVVAIIGVLAAIALPKFGDLIQKSKEAALKAKVGSIRSAISIYYADNEGLFPYQEDPFGWTTQQLYPTLVPKYMADRKAFMIGVPVRGIPYVDSDDEWAPNPVLSRTRNDIAGGVGDLHVSGLGTTMYTPIGGDYFLFCTHSDASSRIWSMF